jgi:hypothetical protein
MEKYQRPPLEKLRVPKVGAVIFSAALALSGPGAQRLPDNFASPSAVLPAGEQSSEKKKGERLPSNPKTANSVEQVVPHKA